MAGPVAAWNEKQLPDLAGRTYVVTGANSGIGWETARTLAERRAEVVLAVRSEERGAEAVARIRASVPDAVLAVVRLDLADLGSVRACAVLLRERYGSLSGLINNAGVMIPPYRLTKDGFELQFGCNHLGHFALTGLLLPLLTDAGGAGPDRPHPRQHRPEDGARIVTVTSLAARSGRIDFDNLDGKRGYRAAKCYGQSKLANLLFALTLQRKLEAAGNPVVSVACHPGLAVTNLLSRGSGKPTPWLLRKLFAAVGQSAGQGALPTLYAATHPSIRGGELIGPDGQGAKKGNPAPDPVGLSRYDDETAERLWSVSERLTGVAYGL